jgi:flagellar protein FlaI
MNTGHDGSMGSLHANTAAETVTRLINPPMQVPSIMLSGLDLIVVQTRMHLRGKSVRRVLEVAEIAGMEGDKPRLNPIWKHDPATDEMLKTGVPSKLRETICQASGIKPADFDAHLQQREKILLDMQARKIRDIESVTRIIQSYYSSQR